MDTRIKTSKTIKLPEWVRDIDLGRIDLTSESARMAFVVNLAIRNVEAGTGGPFAAAVYDKQRKKLVSIGVNVVETGGTSIAHAEIMAIMLAQEQNHEFRLSSPDLELVSSAQPCAMCYGAVFWSGIKSVIYGADKIDVQTITGFDEGPLPENWTTELGNRGITIKQVDRQAACKVLQLYHDQQGTIY